MIESERVIAFVFDTLKADATFNAAVGGRLYRDQVPQSAQLPAAIVSAVTSTDSNTLSGNRVMSSVMVDVHLIASGSSYGPINPAADRADAVLQGQSGPKNGAQVVKLRRTQPTSYLETASGVTYAHHVQTFLTEAHAL